MDVNGLNVIISTTGEQQAVRAFGTVDAAAQRVRDQVAKALAQTNNDVGRLGDVLAGASAKASSGLEQVAAASEGLGRRGATAVQGVSRGLEVMARTGAISGRSLDQIIARVSQLALGFGEGGLLVGAVGIGTAAIVEMFTRTNRELERTQAEFTTRLVSMADSANLAGIQGRSGTQTKLFSGDPYAKLAGRSAYPTMSRPQFTLESEGIQGLTRLRDSIGASLNTVYDAKTGLAKGKEYNKDLNETIDLLKQANAQYAETKRIGDALQKQFTAESRVPKSPRDDAAALRSIAIDQVKQHTQSLNRIAGYGAATQGNANDAAYKTGTMSPSSYYAEKIKLSADATAREIADVNAEIAAVQKESSATEVESRRRVATLAAMHDKIAELTAKGAEELARINRERTEDQARSSEELARESVVATKKGLADQLEEWRKFYEKLKREAEDRAKEIGSVIANSITSGIQSVFERGATAGSVFESMTSALLSGLGDMAIHFGESSAAFMGLMQDIQDAIFGFNPILGLAASLGLIAFGAALKGAGSRVASSGAGGASYSSSVPSAIHSTYYVNPSAPSSHSYSAAGLHAAQPLVVHATFLSPHDPTWQRQLNESLAFATRRTG